MGAVNNAVQEGICQGGIWNTQVPVGYRNLAGDQGGCVSEAVIQHIENILCILDSDGIAHPVVKDEQLCFRE